MATPVVPSGRRDIIGDVEYLRRRPGEGILPRDVVVWLPPSYHREPERRFPVLYMHDGHNALDPSTSFAGEDWQIDEVASEMIAAGRIREFLLVAPYCTEDRFEEYGAGTSGRAYLRFLVSDLKAEIDSRYRTLPDRGDTFVMGSSMGGLISLLAVWHHLDVFGGAACLSPYFPDELVASIAAAAEWPQLPVRLYLDNGGDELDESFMPAIDQLLDLLRRRPGVTGGPAWFRDAGAPHHESAWSQRLWRPLDWLLGTAP